MCQKVICTVMTAYPTEMDGISICLSVCLSIFLITVNLINFTLGKCIDEDFRKYSVEFKLFRSTGYICCVLLLPEVHTVLAIERGPLLTIVLQNGKLGAARLVQYMQEQMKKERPERLEMLHYSKLVSLPFCFAKLKHFQHQQCNSRNE